MKTRDKCRELFSLTFTYFLTKLSPFLGLYTLLSPFPAFFTSCSEYSTDMHEDLCDTGIFITKGAESVNGMDIFVFMDDRQEKLECYQKIADTGEWSGNVVSGSGERIISICANSKTEAKEWYEVTSRSYLRNMSRSLEDENRNSLFLCGETKTKAGIPADITLRPLASEVILRSLSCDFTGKPYAGERLKNVKVYLTNVNAECRILPEEQIMPTRLINVGKLNEDDIALFKEPDMIVQEIYGEIGKKTAYPSVRLLCYPNNSTEESPGTPFTRLVIEGSIGEDVYYWPIEINRVGGGIAANRRYIFDVRITRKGTAAPDIPVHLNDIETTFTITSWQEKDDCTVKF